MSGAWTTPVADAHLALHERTALPEPARDAEAMAAFVRVFDDAALRSRLVYAARAAVCGLRLFKMYVVCVGRALAGEVLR